MQLSPANVEYVFDYIEQLCGIALDDTKSYLIEARLNPILNQHSAASAVELIDMAKHSSGEAIRKSLIEAMTTRETFFFRDGSLFEAFQFKALPELLDVKIREKNQKLRIWSAAASSGQEAFSIAMVLHEMIPDLHRWDIQILATDISEDALCRGRSGLYSKLEVERGLPSQYVSKYFSLSKDGYRVVDSLRRMVRFQHLNLLSPFHFPQPFDIIFCRNVAIYFEKKNKVDLFRRMLPLLPKYGFLFVGVSESLFDCGPEFKPMFHCKSTFYQPNLTAASFSVTASSNATTAAVAKLPALSTSKSSVVSAPTLTKPPETFSYLASQLTRK